MASGIQLEIDMALSEFQINEAELKAFLTGPRGPVMQSLVRRAIKVESQAKRNASGRPGPNVITGRLRGSITWRLGVDEVSPYVDIGTAVEYAPFVELGTSTSPPYPFLVPALEVLRADA